MLRLNISNKINNGERMYAKIFAQIYDGTLCSKGPWESLVTFQQLLILADKDGCVDMTASAISRRTTIPQRVIDVGIAALLLPDPDSRTPDEEGKRIVPLTEGRSWGWRIVNYTHYRNLRDEESRREYHRKYWHTRKEKLNSTQQLNTPQPELDQGSKQYAVSSKQVTTTDVASPPVTQKVCKKRMQFVKPTLDEVIEYCKQRKNSVSPNAWYSHYESNGWRVGKNPMRNWQAAIRTWESNATKYPQYQGLTEQSNPYKDAL